MLLRLPIAFAVGWIAYLIAMAMTVYDGMLSMIFQPIVGAIFTSLGLLLVTLSGCILLWIPVWRRWRQVGSWICLALLISGITAIIMSWHPSLRITVWDEIEHAYVQSFEPRLAIGGWALLMFAIAYLPRLSLRGDGRWY